MAGLSVQNDNGIYRVRILGRGRDLYIGPYTQNKCRSIVRRLKHAIREYRRVGGSSKPVTIRRGSESISVTCWLPPEVYAYDDLSANKIRNLAGHIQDIIDNEEVDDLQDELLD